MEKAIRYASISKPWLKYYSEKYVNMPVPRCTMYEMLKKGCDLLDKENDPAISYYGNHMSQADLFQNIETYAAAFKEYGIKKGDCVSFLAVYHCLL